MHIVAEIGVNWDGNFDLLKKMMEESKNAGCDSVKLQAFNEELVNNHKQKNRLLKSSVSKKNIEQIHQLAKSINVEWFCTPMYEDAIEFLNPYVKKFKMRELDGRNLLQNKSSKILDLILKTGKEVYVSTQYNPKKSNFYNNPQIKWLYCVPKYPCEISDINFEEIKDFVGYSNHCMELIVPLTAAILGAKIIELHITSDKSKDFVDNNVSFDYREIRQLVELIRKSENIKK